MTAPLPHSPDIFELLDIEEREDTYSRLLVNLLRRSAGLRRRVLARGFGQEPPPAEPVEVLLREKLDESNCVDILLHDPANTWTMFIELKLYSGEHGGQTCRYWRACERRVGPNGRVAGIFLTITGAQAECPSAVSLTHRELTTWIALHLADFQEFPALRIAAEAYVQRAQAPRPVAADDTPARTLLQQSWGLVPRLAGVDALGAALHRGLPGEWTHDAITIQGQGHANPGLQFWQPGWWGDELDDNRWTFNNYDIHLEIELTEGSPWRLKLHFETRPYHTLRELRALQGHADFAVMRDAFRAALRPHAAYLPGWKMSNYPFQIASFKLGADIGPESTLAQLRQQLAPALTAIAPHIHTALAAARQAVALA